MKLKYLIILTALYSCGDIKRRNMTLYMSNGSGINLSSCYIGVDSVTAISAKSAEFWRDGKKSIVYAERIMIGE